MGHEPARWGSSISKGRLPLLMALPGGTRTQTNNTFLRTCVNAMRRSAYVGHQAHIRTLCKRLRVLTRTGERPGRKPMALAGAPRRDRRSSQQAFALTPPMVAYAPVSGCIQLISTMAVCAASASWRHLGNGCANITSSWRMPTSCFGCWAALPLPAWAPPPPLAAEPCHLR